MAVGYSHIIHSNLECDRGRYDICIIPRDNKKVGIIFELKVSTSAAGLPKKAKEALE